jgi:hypothetical protein
MGGEGRRGGGGGEERRQRISFRLLLSEGQQRKKSWGDPAGGVCKRARLLLSAVHGPASGAETHLAGRRCLRWDGCLRGGKLGVAAGPQSFG